LATWTVAGGGVVVPCESLQAVSAGSNANSETRVVRAKVPITLKPSELAAGSETPFSKV